MTEAEHIRAMLERGVTDEVVRRALEDALVRAEVATNGECRAEVKSKCRIHGKKETPEEKARLDAEEKKAHAAINLCVARQTDVSNAFYREGIGTIDVVWGNKEKGIKHILERRNAYAFAHKGAPNGWETLKKLPNIIVRGEIVEDKRKPGGPYSIVTIVHQGHRVILTRDATRPNHWILGGYKLDDEARGYRKKPT